MIQIVSTILSYSSSEKSVLTTKLLSLLLIPYRILMKWASLVQSLNRSVSGTKTFFRKSTKL